MKSEREYVFLSLMIPSELANEVKSNSINTMSDAANALEYNLMKGFSANLAVTPKVINILPIGSYPQYYKKIFVKESAFELYGRNDNINLGFCNFKFIRNYFIEKAVYKTLKKYCQKKNGEVTLFIYSASTEFISAVMKVKKEFPKMIVCDIIADLPGMTNLSNNKSAVLQYFIAYKAQKALRQLECVDGFVLLTKQMADYLQINKPYCVVEGIASETESIELGIDSQEKIILYSGTLHQKFGVMNLVKAFEKIEDPNYRLIICGVGDSEKAIRDAAEKDTRISFMGQLLRSKVLEWQKKATVLVNPRQNNEEFTKYSFPSKTMEYLSSGVPVVAYKLDGIPDEYEQYIQYVKDDSIESLKKKLIEICELPIEKRKKIGNLGRTFVFEKKNSRVQVNKIIEMAEILEKSKKQ